MSYPLFDTGYTLWAADLDAALMSRYGLSVRKLGVHPRQLMERYYGGASVADALAALTAQHGLAR